MKIAGVAAMMITLLSLYAQDADLGRIRELAAEYFARSGAGTVNSRILTSQQPDGSWRDIDYGNQQRGHWPPRTHLVRLEQIASGGELSRIMLAIKTILADRDETETLIFDEIDTGISGRTAQMVSEKMARIGQRHQVLCITHLPQIAAMADRHFEIRKDVEDQETVTSIHALDEDHSVLELARMLGGAKITDSVIANAKEMKELARVQKNTRLK